MKCDSGASFASPCFGREPKARVVKNVMHINHMDANFHIVTWPPTIIEKMVGCLHFKFQHYLINIWVQMIEQANGVTLNKDYKSFCPKLVFYANKFLD
jgi:hypothetical protein